MKLMIIGASGLLGTTLNFRLSEISDFQVYGCSRKAELKIDLTNLDSTMSSVQNLSPDLVINLSALTNVDECEENPEMAYIQNALTCQNLNLASQKFGFKIIHISTDHLYNNSGESVESEISPINYYAYSKLLGEQYLPNAVILRTNFFGKSMTQKKSFSDWIFNELSLEKKINLFTDSLFSPLTLDDLSDSILSVIRNFQPGIYNLGSHDGFSKFDFGMLFADKLKLNKDLIQAKTCSEMSLKAKRPLDMRMNSEKFEKTFKHKLPTLKNLIIKESKKYE